MSVENALKLLELGAGVFGEEHRWIKKKARCRRRLEASCQDGGMAKCSLPPCTTRAKLQWKYRTAITKNHQKTEPYGSLITKELKKPHSSRWGGGTQWQRHRMG